MTSNPDTDESAGRQGAIRRFYGDALRVSDWITVTQNMIDQFCTATSDNDWMHVDPVRAAGESPFGGCVAPGFWSLSMLPSLARSVTGDGYPAGAALAINYGFDRIRFTGPVPVGSRIRLAFKLVEISARERCRYLVRSSTTVEVEGRDQPALVAEWMFLLVYCD